MPPVPPISVGTLLTPCPGSTPSSSLHPWPWPHGWPRLAASVTIFPSGTKPTYLSGWASVLFLGGCREKGYSLMRGDPGPLTGIGASVWGCKEMVPPTIGPSPCPYSLCTESPFQGSGGSGWFLSLEELSGICSAPILSSHLRTPNLSGTDVWG